MDGGEVMPGHQTRYDRFTPNAIDLARERQSVGMETPKAFKVAFCIKCQSDKPTKGGKRPRPGVFVCGQCSGV
jgi:hypothetical protein